MFFSFIFSIISAPPKKKLFSSLVFWCFSYPPPFLHKARNLYLFFLSLGNFSFVSKKPWVLKEIKMIQKKKKKEKNLDDWKPKKTWEKEKTLLNIVCFVKGACWVNVTSVCLSVIFFILFFFFFFNLKKKFFEARTQLSPTFFFTLRSHNKHNCPPPFKKS